MPRNNTVTVGADWVELTSADVTAISFQVSGGGTVRVQGAVGAVAPVDDEGAWVYRPGLGESDAPLTTLFPGVPGATRVFARSDTGSAVEVQHA